MEPPAFQSFLSVFIFFFLFKILTLSSADYYRYTNCSNPLICGTTNFTYPFWGEGRPSYCGYPGFELLCNGGSAKIQIMGRKYNLLQINPQRHSIIVSPTGYTNTFCPFNIENTTLDLTIFDYSQDVVNLTLYSTCIPPELSPDLPRELTCSGESANITGFLATTRIEVSIGNNPLLDYLIRCSRKVLVPVKRVEEEALESSSNLISRVFLAINSGFAIFWKANNAGCDVCMKSSGLCGFDSGGFRCYCRDRTYPVACESGTTSKNKILVAGIAAGSSIFAVIGIIGFIVFTIRRGRRSVSSDGSSSRVSIGFLRDFSFDSTKSSSYSGLQLFSYGELEEATNNFDPSRELGDGGFGVVYYGKLRDERDVAVKRLHRRNIKSEEQFMNEVQILARLRHTNLVALYGCTSRRSKELLLVYEYVPNGTVADHIQGPRSRSGFLPWHLRFSIAAETASAISFLHESGVIHRDVKTNNILLDDEFRVKVADFGLSRLFPLDATHISTAPQGTPGYVDPEYYSCYQVTDRSDVYSFGVVLMELVSSKEAVDFARSRQEVNLANLAMTKIRNRLLHELVDPQLGFQKDDDVRKEITLVCELAFRCLQQDRNVRPSMCEIVDILRGIAGAASKGECEQRR